MPKKRILIALLLAMLAGCIHAEPSAGIPREQAARIAEMGVAIDPPGSWAIYAPLAEYPPYDGVTVFQDIPYGSDALQGLDIYSPQRSAATSPLPVLIFVHGGAFFTGDKQGNYFPQNVTLWAARNEMIGVNINYRLAPADTWPAGRDDLASTIAWVRDNIAQYGGDPKRIVLVGHSSGANHVADYISHVDRLGPEADGVIGAALLSVGYFPDDIDAPNVYYGSDLDLQTNSPAVRRLANSTIPFLLAYSEYDPPMFHDFADLVRTELCDGSRQSRCPQIVYSEGHNHFTASASLNTVDQSLSRPLLRWIEGL